MSWFHKFGERMQKKENTKVTNVECAVKDVSEKERIMNLYVDEVNDAFNKCAGAGVGRNFWTPIKVVLVLLLPRLDRMTNSIKKM